MEQDPRLESFGKLLKIMDELREQCPWDKKQTFESLRHLTIEETYELADAILSKDMQGIKKECGDILLHIVFYARMGSETGDFDIKQIIDSLCEKLIHRHPHIYGDVKVSGEDEVKQNWEKLKLKEGSQSVLEGVPGSMPALIKAMRMQEKARAVGFDWERPEQVWEKVSEELGELREVAEAETKDQKRIEDEFGDLLFALVNYSRFIDVNPEEALERTNRKFRHRFTYLEKAAREAGRSLEEMSLEEMDVYWNKAKELE